MSQETVVRFCRILSDFQITNFPSPQAFGNLLFPSLRGKHVDCRWTIFWAFPVSVTLGFISRYCSGQTALSSFKDLAVIPQSVSFGICIAWPTAGLYRDIGTKLRENSGIFWRVNILLSGQRLTIQLTYLYIRELKRVCLGKGGS
jgi:hypothetical protein